MNNEPQEGRSSPAAPIDPRVGETTTTPPPSPWEDYLTGKKMRPERFLANLAKSAISIPSQQMRARFVDTVFRKPEHLRRFLALMRASESSGSTISAVVLGLAEDTIRRFIPTGLPEPLDPSAYKQAVATWLEGKSKRPVKPVELTTLFVFLRFGHVKKVLDDETIIELTASSVARPAKPGKKQTQRIKPTPTPIETLLDATPAAPVIASLVTGFKAWAALVEQRDRDFRSRAEEISRLKSEIGDMADLISSLRAEVTALRERHAKAEAKIAELEKLIVDLTDGWQHKLDQLQGRVRGVMQGQLTRWLRTALDAARSDPPFLKAVEERLEDALRLTDGELEWLRRSD